MTFDIVAFAREAVAVATPAKLLTLARDAAAEVCASPVFAAHLSPDCQWEHALLACPAAAGAPAAAAVRPALSAVHRRLSLAPQTLYLQRAPDTEALFKALCPKGQVLCAVPLRNRDGATTGSLVVDETALGGNAETLRSLEAIAAIAGTSLQAAWQHAGARREQERLQLLSETTADSIWDLDVASGEMWWGGRLDHVLGARPSMPKRADWRHARTHPDDVDRVIGSFESALRSQASSWNVPYRLRGPEGQDIHVREHAYFLRDATGLAYRAIGTIRDVSALKELLQRERAARAQAEQASQVKDQFLAMLGHELRNPLAPIVTVITLLELRAAGPDKHLEILRRQTQHLVRLVDDLMDVARISSGKVELTKTRTLVAPLLQRAAEMSQPIFEQRRHRLDIDLSPDVEIDADTARMTQVLTNLLSNAAKYTEPGGQVSVQVRQEAGQAVIRIRDNGIGIAAEFLPRIFEMFSQSHQALDRAQGGLGLGLAIVRNLVQQHGGAVQAFSEGPGRGAEMVVRLPLAAEAAAPVPVPPDATGWEAAACSVLVVDDNQDAAALLGEWFHGHGCRVRIAHHPAQALEMFEQERPEVALVDIGLPAMDGYELVRRMRALPGGAGSRIVAVTGYGSAADVQKALAAGFDAHLAKPISLGWLAQMLAQLQKAKTAA